jgi:hypothetical protein
MIDPKLIPNTRRRIDQCDYDAVFASDGCFLFALRLQERFGFKIRGFRLVQDGAWTHVWAKKEANRGIDIRGVYPEKLLAKLANGGEAAPEFEDVPVEDVSAAIQKKEYPTELLDELKKLADYIIDTHERFRGVKPPDLKEYTAFVECLQRKANQSPESTPAAVTPPARQAARQS